MAYDEFWQGQALDKLVVQHPSNVPTMWEQGLFDQEDMWGAIHSWTALKQAGHEDNNYLVIGPWRHSGANYDGTTLGELRFNGDTALQWRQDVLKPFFDHYLKDAPKPDTPRAMIYNVGENHWDRSPDNGHLRVPTGPARAKTTLKPLYAPTRGPDPSPPPAAGAGFYISRSREAGAVSSPRPVRFSDHAHRRYRRLYTEPAAFRQPGAERC